MLPLKILIPMLKHQRMCRLTASDDPRVGVLFELRDLAAPVEAGKIVPSKESIVNIWREARSFS